MTLCNSWVLHIRKERPRIDLKTESFKKLTTFSSKLILGILALHFLISSYFYLLSSFHFELLNWLLCLLHEKTYSHGHCSTCANWDECFSLIFCGRGWSTLFCFYCAPSLPDFFFLGFSFRLSLLQILLVCKHQNSFNVAITASSTPQRHY